MEGKELHDEDDEMKSGSKKDQESESDDFGLPDASYDTESEEEEEEESSEESSFEYTPEEESSAEPSAFGEFEDDTPSYRYSPEEESKKTPTGLIVFLSLLGVIIIAIVIYWFFFRTPVEEQEPQPQALEQMMDDETTPSEPIVEEPVEEPEQEPVFEEPIVDVMEGSFETINSRTGRYYIIINSFFDEDLAADYAKDLGELGINTLIIGPPERKGFHRVALREDFGNWSAAENRMNDLKATYGDDIWVLKY